MDGWNAVWTYLPTVQFLEGLSYFWRFQILINRTVHFLKKVLVMSNSTIRTSSTSQNMHQHCFRNWEKIRPVKPSMKLGSIQTLTILNATIIIWDRVHKPQCGLMSSFLTCVCWQVCMRLWAAGGMSHSLTHPHIFPYCARTGTKCYWEFMVHFFLHSFWHILVTNLFYLFNQQFIFVTKVIILLTIKIFIWLVKNISSS